MHPAAFLAVKHLRPRTVARVYEVGSLILNGTIRPLFHDAVAYHGIDRVPGPGVDAVADGATYRPPFAPDCVVCCEVLEHADHARALVQQLAAVVADGGKVIVTCAGPGRLAHSAVDGGPLRAGEYYGPVFPGPLTDWLEAAGLGRVTVLQALGEPAARRGDTDLAGDLYAVGYK